MHFIYISIGKLLLGNLEFLQVKLVEWIYVIWKNIFLSRFGIGFLKLDKNSIFKILVCKHTRVWEFLCDQVGGKEMCVQTQYVRTHSSYKWIITLKNVGTHILLFFTLYE